MRSGSGLPKAGTTPSAPYCSSTLMTVAQRQTAILAVALLACVWLAYSGPGYYDPPSLFSYLLLLALMLPLFLGAFDLAMPDPRSRYAALFGVAWYGLNPANTATLADLTRRPIVWSALGVVAGLVLYQWRPAWRKYGVYLAPVAGAACCHRQTIVFAPLLFAFVFLGEKNAESRAIPAIVLKCIPAALVSSAALLLVKADPMIPGETAAAGAVRGLAAFLLPFAPAGPYQAGTGLPLVILLGAAVSTAFWRQTRLVSFGLWWFLLAVVAAPGEPLPACIGLALAISSALALCPEARRWLAPAGCACLLIAGAYAIVDRNDVLAAGFEHTQVLQSRDPKQWLRLSDFYYQGGRFPEAIAAATSAVKLKPDFAEGYNNMGAAFVSLRMWDEAVQASQAAFRLKPDDPVIRKNLAGAEAQRLRSR